MTMPIEDEYEPKGAILLTGGAGFIGSHVVDRLARAWPQDPKRVIVLDSLEYCASLENLRDALGLPNVSFVQGDLQSLDLLRYLMDSEGVDTVLHFAAQTHVDTSFGNSIAFTMANTVGTHCLLEAARMAKKPVRRFVCVSTDEVYGDASAEASVGLLEGCRLEPTNPYSAAKAGAEMMCSAYACSYRMPIIITRGNNVYGPRQYPEKLVPKMLLLALEGKTLPVHGDGSAVRSYLYVDDVASAFETILKRGAAGEIYNIGTEQEMTVMQVVDHVMRIVRDRQREDVSTKLEMQAESAITHVPDRAFNDRRYFIGSSKLQGLGWRPSTNWQEGLRKTMDWYVSEPGARDGTRWVGGSLQTALQP